MPRLFLLDDSGGRLALLAAGMASLQGAPGFSQVIPCSPAAPSDDPLPAAALAEVGLLLPPVVQNFSTLERSPADLLVSIGREPFPGASAHWACSFPDDDAPPLARRAGARIARDLLARLLDTLLR
jgi:hypothetical protein